MSDPRNPIEDLPQPEQELTPEQAAEVAGGASDYLLELDGVKGESKIQSAPSRYGLTKTGAGTLILPG